MEITLRSLMTSVHGMLFGGLFLLALVAIAAELFRSVNELRPAELSLHGVRLERAYLAAMALCGWLAVLSGTYIIYPWYRAAPPPGANLMDYPRSFLLAHPNMAQWHSLGMEWKEHIGWIAPIVATMLAAVLLRHRATLRREPKLRAAVLTFAAVGVFATAAAGLFGAMLDKEAPVNGGRNITIISSTGGQR